MDATLTNENVVYKGTSKVVVNKHFHPVSVIITTFNEEDNIQALIESVIWADEIIVVDSYSNDQTVDIAKEQGAKVLLRHYKSPADQKNWAIKQASNEWVLILDADERVTPELKIEIELLLQGNILYDAYWIGRQNHFMSSKIRYSGWQNDKVIRLIKRDVCQYNDLMVHEEIQTDQISVSKLKNKLQHFTFKDVDHFVSKMQRYSGDSALDHLHKTSTITGYHLFVKPAFRFFKHYILKGGILDGKAGFVISVIMAWGVFLRYLKIKEIRRNIHQPKLIAGRQGPKSERSFSCV